MTTRKKPAKKARTTPPVKAKTAKQTKPEKASAPPRQAKSQKTTKPKVTSKSPRPRRGRVIAPKQRAAPEGDPVVRGRLFAIEDRTNGGWGVARLVEGKFVFVDGERFERQDDASTYAEVVEEEGR